MVKTYEEEVGKAYMNINEIMFSLIRKEICQKEIEADVKKHLSSSEFSKLYTLSTEHDIFNIVASALSDIDVFTDNGIKNRIKKQLMMSVYHYERMNYDILLISQIFEKAEIKFILLKGAVIRDYYPEPWMRSSCDIDILIHQADTEKAIKVLCDSGFSREIDSSTYDYSLMSPNKVHLELHFTLTTDGVFPTTDSILESVWHYAMIDKENSYKYNLTNEMLIFYHIVHMAKHFVKGGCGIRPFIDLWLLENSLSLDTVKLNGMLEEANLLVFYESVLSLVEVWFESASHNEVTEQMEKFILNGGVYGTADNLAMVKAAKGEGKLRSFLKLMFLSRNNLEVIYPNLRRYPRLFYLYQVKRWFRIFRSDKRNKVQYITKVRNSILDDDVNSTNNLLNQLKLFQ